MKETFPACVRVQRLAQLNLGWVGSGDLVIKRYFESGSESRQAVLWSLLIYTFFYHVEKFRRKSKIFVNVILRFWCVQHVGTIF